MGGRRSRAADVGRHAAYYISLAGQMWRSGMHQRWWLRQRPRDWPLLLTLGRLCAQRERRSAVRDALAALPEHYRLALVLFDIEGQSYDEIAQTLQLPLGTVKSRINRARLALRDRLQGVRELFED